VTEPIACPDPVSLQRLLTGALTEFEQAQVSGHIDTCAHCQHTLEELAAGGLSCPDAVRELSRQSQPAEPGLRRVMAELKRELGEYAATGAPNTSETPALEFLDPPKRPGTVGGLGPYEITALIGRGGMGIVLKAFDPALHREVAVKVMAPYLEVDPGARQRFLREARAAAAVVHPHVVTVHAVSEHNGLPYLVMEYVPGLSLQARLNRGGPLGLCDILRVGADTAGGLAAAHARGLIHRDIKPANLLLTPAGPGMDAWRVKITDFGLARSAAGTELSHEGTLAGTPDYMAPEQARGKTVDHRADLFALGSVLYTLCAGRVPFQADTQLAVLHLVCAEVPRPVRELNAAVPDWLAEIVQKLHAKDPADRFQSAAELAELLNRHLASLGQPCALPPGLRLRMGFEYRSRRTLWGLPLLHFATGWDPASGRKRIAKGVIAVGEIAAGVVALGVIACGGLAVGGCALGLLAIGGAAFGVPLALGGFAVGVVAAGGGAVGYYALGGWARGLHSLSNSVHDPAAAEFFRRWFGFTD
jgi:serine/threonine-protein kinase